MSCLQQPGLCLVSSRGLQQKPGKEQLSLMSSHLLTISSARDFQKQMCFLSGCSRRFLFNELCCCGSFCAAIAEQAAVVLFVRAVTKASLWGFWKGGFFALIRVSLTRVLKGVLPVGTVHLKCLSVSLYRLQLPCVSSRCGVLHKINSLWMELNCMCSPRSSLMHPTCQGLSIRRAALAFG